MTIGTPLDPNAEMISAMSASDRRRLRRSLVSGWIVMIIVAYLLGICACALNYALYVQHGPFFDSCAYYNTLAYVIATVRHGGVAKAFAALSNQTVFLPWLEAVVFARIPGDVSRSMGVWIQVSWVIPLLLSLYFYFHVLKNRDPATAFASTLPLVSIPIFFAYDGGLSDFRMDLGLYLFYALSGIWYLATYETDRLYPWIFLGVSMGLAALQRATSPVYFAVGLGPLLLLRLVFSRDRGRFLRNGIFSLAITVAICGWFYIKNFAFLKYYYVDWNLDANAHLPLSQSWRHILFVGRDVGWAAPIVCAVIGATSMLAGGWRALAARISRPARFLGDLNWAALYIGVAPVAMLIFRGAGNNPFVSMPSCFCLMFLLSVDRRSFPAKTSAWRGGVLAALAIILLVRTSVAAVYDHVHEPTETRMSAHRQLIDQMLSDAHEHHRDNIRFAATHLVWLQGTSIENVMIFDYGFAPAGNNILRRESCHVLIDKALQSATKLDLAWTGATSDAQRIDRLIRHASEMVDYIEFPDDATLKGAETGLSYFYANSICRQFRDGALRTGCFVPLGSPIVNSRYETVQLYVNRKRVR